MFNDGYDTLTLHKRCLKWGTDIDDINLELGFPNGIHLGVVKKMVHVTVELTYLKQRSFTKKLILTAPDKKEYYIMISGTVDNSLLSCNSFLLRFARN